MRPKGQEPISCFCSMRQLDEQVLPLDVTLYFAGTSPNPIPFFSGRGPNSDLPISRTLRPVSYVGKKGDLRVQYVTRQRVVA